MNWERSWKTRLNVTELPEVFEYGKNNEGYWDKAKHYTQVVDKTLPIVEALYSGSSLLFLFDDATSHSGYAKDKLPARIMNKGIRKKQSTTMQQVVLWKQFTKSTTDKFLRYWRKLDSRRDATSFGKVNVVACKRAKFGVSQTQML